MLSVDPAGAETFTLVLPPGGISTESPGALKPSLPTFTSGVVGSCSSPVLRRLGPVAQLDLPASLDGHNVLLEVHAIGDAAVRHHLGAADRVDLRDLGCRGKRGYREGGRDQDGEGA